MMLSLPSFLAAASSAVIPPMSAADCACAAGLVPVAADGVALALELALEPAPALLVSDDFLLLLLQAPRPPTTMIAATVATAPRRPIRTTPTCVSCQNHADHRSAGADRCRVDLSGTQQRAGVVVPTVTHAT